MAEQDLSYNRKVALYELLAQVSAHQSNPTRVSTDMAGWFHQVRTHMPIDCFSSWPPMGGYVYQYHDGNEICYLQVNPGGVDKIAELTKGETASEEMMAIWSSIVAFVKSTNYPRLLSKYAQFYDLFDGWAGNQMQVAETIIEGDTTVYRIKLRTEVELQVGKIVLPHFYRVEMGASKGTLFYAVIAAGQDSIQLIPLTQIVIAGIVFTGLANKHEKFVTARISDAESLIIECERRIIKRKEDERLSARAADC